MRFLVADPGPSFSVADVYAGWVEGLREAGQAVVEYNLGDRLSFFGAAHLEVDGEFKRPFAAQQVVELAADGLYGAVMKARPHVLLAVSAFFLPHEMFDIVRAAGVRVAVLHTESPYEDDRQIAVASHADLNLVNDPTNLDAFRAVAPTEYVPHAYRPTIHHPGPASPDLACDFAFVGTGYPSRVEFFEAMDLDGLDVVLAGNWQAAAPESPLRKYVAHDLAECFDNTDTADVYRSAKVGINLYRREAQRSELSAGWAMGPREVELAACGAFYLRDPRGEGDELLPMLPTFTSPAEASEQLRWWLAHPDARAAVAAQAREAVADRTFVNNARRLVGLLDKGVTQ